MKVLSLTAALLLHACGKAPHHGPPPTEKAPSVGYVAGGWLEHTAAARVAKRPE
jgi:hypothetical protein